MTRIKTNRIALNYFNAFMNMKKKHELVPGISVWKKC